MKFERKAEVELEAEKVAEPFAEEYFNRLLDLIEYSDIGDYLESEYGVQLANANPSEFREFVKEVRMEILNQIALRLFNY